MNIALMSHDNKKDLMVQFCTAYAGILSRHHIYATNTTGHMVAEATGLQVHCFLSYAHGGSQQIGARIAYNEMDMVLFFAIFLPFVMPKIHERYFFMADMLSILYAARRGDRRFVPLLVIGASLMSYMPILTRQRPVGERILGLMMLGALIAVSRDLLSAMRQNRRTLAKGGETA